MYNLQWQSKDELEYQIKWNKLLIEHIQEQQPDFSDISNGSQCNICFSYEHKHAHAAC